MENRTQDHQPLTADEAAARPPGTQAVPINGRAGLLGYFLVDDADFPRLSAMSWNLSKREGRKEYPYSGSDGGGTRLAHRSAKFHG